MINLNSAIAQYLHVYRKYNISRNKNYGSLYRLPIIRKNVTLNHGVYSTMAAATAPSMLKCPDYIFPTWIFCLIVDFVLINFI